MPDKKIKVRKKGTEGVKYDESKDKMGNVLPEAEVVTYTGSAAVQAMKKRQDKRRKRRGRLSKRIREILAKREAKGKA